MIAAEPQISVIIPCYNASQWIAETIASAVSQQDVTSEIIVVDDESTDDGVERAIAAAGDVRLNVISQRRSGASRARTVGTRAARGAFVQYLDADDVLLPGTLAKRLQLLSKTGGDVAYCDWAKFDAQPDGTFREKDVVDHELGARPDVELLNGAAWWPPAALLYRREVVDAVGDWREDLPVIQDARFLLDAALSGARFVHAQHLGARYRTHSGSLSRRSPIAFVEDCYHNGRDLEERWAQAGTLDSERRQALAGLYAFVARSYYPLDRKRYRVVIEHLKTFQPAYVPPGRGAMRTISRLSSYPTAVRVATWYEQLKALG